MKFFKHLRTVCRHRRQVRKNCFKAGLVWQGLTHDLSKFSLKEFVPGVKYYQGTRSPQAKERELFGYSAAWLHHKGRNKHHFEYWTDVNAVGETVCVEM
ncbi:MAG: catalase, partial [Clostridia bacterium]|nr:catalase [Clostridia bacterium]